MWSPCSCNGAGIQSDGFIGAGLSEDATISEAACPGDGVVGTEDGDWGREDLSFEEIDLTGDETR